MDSTLMAISKDELENFKDYRTKGEEVANKILERLKTSKTYGVSRVKVGGSIGKRTALGAQTQPDFDVVVFVNGEKPPFEVILRSFQRILFPHTPHGQSHNSATTTASNDFLLIEATPYSLKILAKSDEDGSSYSFDVLPAANLISPEHHNISGSGSEREKIQIERVLNTISRLHNPATASRFYGSSLAEKTVEFVEKQSSFVHDVIRLGKLWNRKVDDLPYLYGRSMMIELLALWVAVKEESSGSGPAGRVPSISSAFQAFLEKLIKFDEMDIIFDYPVNPNMSDVHQKYLEQTKVRPVILDPLNPYNNFAEKVTAEMKSVLSSDAAEGLKHIRSDNIEAVKHFFET